MVSTTLPLYVTIVSKSLLTIFDTGLIIILVWTLRRTTIETKETKNVIVACVIYLICMSFAFGLSTIRTSIFGVDQFVTLLSSIMYSVRLIFEIAAFIIYYSILAYQVVSVFRNTHFAIGKKTIWMHRGIIILVFVCSAVVVFGFLLQLVPLILGGTAVAVLVYLIGYHHLVFLFNWKLYKMIKYSCLQNKAEATSSPMINIMRRSTVLVTIYAVFNFLLIVAVILVPIYVDYSISFSLVNVFITLQYCCGALCLFLMLRINGKYYHCLCKICDSRFKKCCDNIAVQNEIAELQLEQIQSATLPHSASSKTQRESSVPQSHP